MGTGDRYLRDCLFLSFFLQSAAFVCGVEGFLGRGGGLGQKKGGGGGLRHI